MISSGIGSISPNARQVIASTILEERFNHAELEALYESLSPEERDELLQHLLIAASISGEMVMQRLEECLLGVAGRELIEGMPETLPTAPRAEW